jgi:hypothetical protein
MTNDLQDAVGRAIWRDGQVLASGDLNGEWSDEARRRRLHVRYLHRTGGIALGFTVQASSAGVTVAPGYAIDNAGRDLLLSQPLVLPLPGDGTFILVAAFDSAAACRPSLPAADFCAGPDPERERAAISWVAGNAASVGTQVPLARAMIAGGAITGDLDFRVRVNARRLVKPYVASGITQAGATNWSDASGLHAPNLYLEAQIDTSAGGFLVTPGYFAALRRANAPGQHPRAGSLDEAAKPFGSQPAFSLDGLGVITRPTTQGFTFRMPRGALPLGVDLTAKEAEAGGWVVAWVGFEPVTGYEPLFNLATILEFLVPSL